MSTPNKPLKMFNLNVNVSTSLGSGGLFECTTPRTPEILNTLVAMTNPFDTLEKTGQENTSPLCETNRLMAASPVGSQTSSPPSVQHTCSQLIKEGLKLTLQSKRKNSWSDYKDDDEPLVKRSKNDELTTEDEERRKRRRERNKIAATKCRMKKREKTANLITESEVLENQNIEMKTQIKDLERQRRNLEDMLNQHVCVHRPAIAASTANTTGAGAVSSTAPSASSTPYQVFQQPVEPFIDPDFGEDAALLSYNKDPNFGKFMDNFFPHNNGPINRVVRGKIEMGTSNYSPCDEEADSYRPNGNGLLEGYFSQNDSGYSSSSGHFIASAIDPTCRA